MWRAVLKRSRSDWPVVLAAALLLLAATTLLATGSLYSDTVALGGLRRAILDAPPLERAVVVETTLVPADLERIEGIVVTEIRRALKVTGGDVLRVARSGSLADASIDPDEVTDLTVLASHEDIAAHATLVDGSWPTAGADTIEAVLSEGASIGMGLGVGDTTRLVSRLDADRVIDIRIVGIWRPDEDDGYWLADPLELSGIEEAGRYVTRGPLVVAQEDLFASGVATRFELSWRGLAAVDGLRIETIGAFRSDVDLLDNRLSAELPGAVQFRVSAALPGILDEVNSAILVSRSGVLLLTIQFAVLAIYAVILVGGLLLERRRAEVALLRSRGASGRHLVAMALGEAALLAVPAALIAPPLAVGIVNLLAAAGPLAAAGINVQASITPGVLFVTGLAGLGCMVALALPVLTSGASLAGVRAAIGRQTGRTLPQRLGVDLALVVLAGIGLWQLRLYGAPLTRNARGVLGVDPLLVAAPAIGLLAGGILAIRIIPRLAEIGERLLERRRGLVAPLGGRQLARRPLRYTRAALLLMLAAGLGTFASAHAATWSRSQGDQAAYQAASDIRVVVSDYADLPTWAFGPAYRAIDGVEAASPVEEHAFDGGPKVRSEPLLAVDAATAPGMLTFGGADTGDGTRALLATMVEQRPIVSPVELDGRPRRLAISTTDRLRVVFNQREDVPIPDDAQVVRVHAVVRDADGRVHRFGGGTGPLAGEATMEVPLFATVGEREVLPAYPLSLLALEIEILPPIFAILGGVIDLEAIEASEASTGEDWKAVDLDPTTPGWSWLRADPSAPISGFSPPPGRPWRVGVGVDDQGPQELFTAATFRLVPRMNAETPIPAIVSEGYLEATGSQVGEEATITSRGVRMRLRIIGSVTEFPPLDPQRSFVVVDMAALDLTRFAALGQTLPTSEWWVRVADGQQAAVAETLAASPYSAASVVSRDALTGELTTDPISLGVIGVLGLGAVAALVFAAIGFVVSATVSASERLGEFALLQALGLSGRQLSIWLSLESAFLLVVGLVAGTGLGFLLAWLVLPFATLTETGVAAVPSPVVVIPWQQIAPTWLLAVLLLAVTVVAVQRQLPSRRISTVLRAREE